MKELWNSLLATMNVADHILPLVLTGFACLITWAVKTYLPQLHYIQLVSKASNDQGIIDLAKYMAKRNGGKHISTDELWESFVPAAKAIVRRYKENTAK